jgi:predicted nucleic acid-binding protein
MVFDASTLILIAKNGTLVPFLESVGVPVRIPGAVAEEACTAKKSLDSLLIQRAVDESKIRVVSVRDRRLVAKLRRDFGLGLGEAEAIALAHMEKEALLGIDDKNGINACKLLGIPFTTAIGILVRMHEKALLTTEMAVAKLAELGRYGRYKKSILEDAQRRLEGGHD